MGAGRETVSISQSSLGGSRIAFIRRRSYDVFAVSISQSSLGGSRGCRQTAGPHTDFAFQSRNRVWAVHAAPHRVRISQSHQRFNLAIEFGPVHAATGARFQGETASNCFNLAIEFGRFTRGLVSDPADGIDVSISQSSLGGSRDVTTEHVEDYLNVSISQSSLGGSRASARPHPAGKHEFQSRNRVWAVHACDGSKRMATGWRFQSRNRVWAVHALQRWVGCCKRQKSGVSISQSSLGGSRLLRQRRFWEKHYRCVSISQSSLGRFTRAAWRVACLPSAMIRFNLAIEFGRFTREKPFPPSSHLSVSISQSSLGGSRSGVKRW